MASMARGLALRQMMARPLTWARSSASFSQPSAVVEITWLGMMSLNFSNQKLLIWVRTAPLSGMGSFITTSKALRRSVATSSRASGLPLRAGIL